MSLGLHHQIFLPACFDSVAISCLNVSMLYLLIVSISASLRSTPCPLRHSTPHTVALPTCERHTRAGHMLLTSCPCICCTMLSLPCEHDGPACRHAGVQPGALGSQLDTATDLPVAFCPMPFVYKPVLITLGNTSRCALMGPCVHVSVCEEQQPLHAGVLQQ